MKIQKILTVLFLLLSQLSLQAQTEKEIVDQTLDQATIKGHIYFLASDELTGRKTGTQGIDVAAKYLATSFMRYGVMPVEGADDLYFQKVPLVKNIPATVSTLKIGSEEVSSDDLLLVNGEDVDLQEEFIFLGYGTSDEFEKGNVKGKVAITFAGTSTAQDLRTVFSESRSKTERAKAAGAIGLIELHNSNPENWPQFKRYIGGSSISIKKEESQSQAEEFFKIWVKDNSQTWTKRVGLKMKQKIEVKVSDMQELAIHSKNVVGMVEGTDPKLKEEYVIYSAHYDHLGYGTVNAEGDSIYNGARDNAVGVVTVMSAAESIAKHPTKRSALFILFTAEEEGLLGSRYYTENPLLPLNEMVYCFNSDNGGYNDTSIATIVGLERTTAGKHIKEASTAYGLNAIDDPAGEQGLFDRSDNVNFAKKGIPAPTFSLGFTAFDAEIGKYYHQLGDNAESLDYDYLKKFFGAFVLSARLIANDEKTPFWTKGDKYYDSGIELYNKK